MKIYSSLKSKMEFPCGEQIDHYKTRIDADNGQLASRKGRKNLLGVSLSRKGGRS